MVRYQLAFSLGNLDLPDQTSAMAEIIRRDHNSAWVRAAVMSSLAGGAGKLFAQLSGDPVISLSPGGQDFLRELLTQIGAQNRSSEVSQAIEYLTITTELESSLASAGALGNGLKRAGSNLSQADPDHKLKRLLESAADALNEKGTGETLRIQAIRLLGLSSFSESGLKLLALLGVEQTQKIQMEAINALARFSEPELGSELIQRWTKLTPTLARWRP